MVVVAWGSQIDTPGDHVGCEGSKLKSRECASDMLLHVHRDLGGGLELPGMTCCIHEGLSQELETDCYGLQNWREHGWGWLQFCQQTG